jgi:2-polyprenyl-3-methyl-5-hydroxy-6-metoxy-1,4-benzoquinol methylase
MGIKDNRCIICNSDRLVVMLKLGSQQLLRCQACDYVFHYPIPSQEELDTYMIASYQGEGLEETKDIFAHCGKGYGDGPIIKEYKTALARLTYHTEGRQLLDVGCGPGTFLDIARQNGWSVLGIDSCPSACYFAEEEFGLRILNTRFEQADLSAPPFDVVTMWDFLEHVPNPVAVLTEAHNRLRNQGLLLLSLPNRCSLIYGLAKVLIKANIPFFRHEAQKLFHFSHISYFSVVSLDYLLQRTGFVIIEKHYLNPYLGRYQMPWYHKGLLQLVFSLAKLIKAQSRLLMIAKKNERM